MYAVNVNGQNVRTASSYEKAIAEAKSAATDVANTILNRASAFLSNPRLGRSPKARRNVAQNLSRQAMNVAGGVKFPKKFADAQPVNVGGNTFEIVKA